MTAVEKRLAEAAAGLVGSLSGREALEMLIAEGLVDRRALERCYARRRFDRLVAAGMGRCRAMDEVAHELCCSYEKVRTIIYARRSNNI